MRRVGAAGVEVAPVVVLALCHDVLGIRKCRDPAAIDQARVPADMVPVQVRAHNVIDFFRLHPEPRQIVDERGAHAVELRPARAFLVVADAGVDQDRVPAGAHDEAVKAEDQPAGFRIEQAWTEQIGVFLDDGRIEIRKEFGRIEKRSLVIGNAADLEIADANGLHGSSRVLSGSVARL
jgi:hypothetical protein